MADEDTALFNEIVSSEPSAQSEPSPTTETEQPAPASGRDDLGRFKSSEPEAPAQPVATDPPEPAGMVPQQALHETRQQLKDERERREALERRIASFEQAAQPKAPTAEPPKPIDFWEDPRKFVESAIAPLQESLRQQNEVSSRRTAVKEHGKEIVQGAYTAMGEALKSDPSVREVYQRIMASQDPFEDLVLWHKESQNRARIGSDPDAFVTSELEKMIADPTKRQELLARLNGTAVPAETASPANVTRLPPSLNKIGSPANAASTGGPQSDAELFASITGR